MVSSHLPDKPCFFEVDLFVLQTGSTRHPPMHWARPMDRNSSSSERRGVRRGLGRPAELQRVPTAGAEGAAAHSARFPRLGGLRDALHGLVSLCLLGCFNWRLVLVYMLQVA